MARKNIRRIEELKWGAEDLKSVFVWVHHREISEVADLLKRTH